MQDREKILQAAADSLRSVVSVRDFLVAVQVGAETAGAMLDGVEAKLLEATRLLNEDHDR
jgi:hypothetical protein